MASKHVLSILKRLPEERVNSKSFNEAFQLDGIPLWDFLDPLMGSYLPKPFEPWWEIEKNIKSNELPSSFNNLKFDLSAFGLKKGLMISESIKYLISQLGKKDTEIEKRDVLFIATTDQISEENEELRSLEFGKIVDCLKKCGSVKSLVLICDPFSKNSFFKLRRYRPLLYDYITPQIIEESKRLSNELHKKWKALDEKIKAKLFSWKGHSYWGFFRKNIDLLFSKEVLFTLIKYYLTVKSVLEVHNVKVIYCTSFSGFYGLSTLGAAYKLNRKVVYSPHGYTGAPDGRKKFMKNIFFAAARKLRIKERNRFLRGSIGREKIIVTGSPFLDEIVDYKQRKPGEAKKIVTLLTTSLVESRLMEKERYFELIRKVLVQIAHVKEVGKLIIKLHPNEKYKSEYESITKSLNLKNVEIVQKLGKTVLYSTMSDSDLLIGFGSTALLEGLMMDKDAIHLDEFTKGWGKFDFTKATVRVRNLNDLAKTIRRILTDKKLKGKIKQKRERYLRRSFYKIDGKAHMRVADLIERVSKRY